jgi:hypothetical protein
MKSMFVISSLTLIGGFCVFCIIQPRRVAAYARSEFLKSSKWVRHWPSVKIVMMEWFPASLRGMGFIGLMAVLVALVNFLQTNSK